MSSLSSISGSTAYQQAMLSQQIQIATLAKSQDVMKAEGEAVLELLQAAVELASVTSSTSSLDVVA